MENGLLLKYHRCHRQCDDKNVTAYMVWEFDIFLVVNGDEDTILPSCIGSALGFFFL